MSGTTPALIAAAAGVGFGHAILPDHWVPLAVVSRARRYSLGRVARVSGLAGVTHVLVSLVLGAIVVVIGLQFRSAVLHAEDAIVGGLLIATGVLFAAFGLAGRGHHSHGHDEHHHRPGVGADHERPDAGGRARGVAAMMVPFGAAASPDLTILPVFLAATAAGAGAAVGSLAAFALVTVGTFVVLTVAATAGGYQLRTRWLDRFAGAITAAVLVILGILVAASVI
jgi:nickel/cobalt exporter